MMRFFFPLFLILIVSCTRPSSWEQFVKVEDAADGAYEFAVPVQASVPSSDVSASSDAATYDLSFYTAPLAEPIQLEVTWLYSPAEVFPVSQKHGHREQKPRENVPSPPSERDTGNTFTAPVFSETVWFPAGQHRALYRSGINFSDDLSRKTAFSIQVPPKNPLPVEENAEISTGTPKNTPTCIENGEKLYRSAVTIQVTPINPPEGFRGLGIICKKNDGTR